MAAVIVIAKLVVAASVAVLLAYAVRHYVLVIARASLRRPRDTMDLVGFHMPFISVLVPMHNEELVAPDILQALVEADYDPERLEILPINDRSTDRTGAILQEFAARYPCIRPIHRHEGRGGKPAALAEATAVARGEVLLLFDADYVPGKSALKMLAAPFVDAQVGAVMGRVVPHNTGDSVLATLLSLERAAGYQGEQQSRFNLGLIAQFGGTVGGVRASALRAVGGWDAASLTEDTDLTCKLALAGWRIAYVNRAECYEEVPPSWSVRRRQLMRWVTGHTGCLHRYWRRVMRSEFLTFGQKADALFMLACYHTAPVMVAGWVASLVLLFTARGESYLALPLLTAFLGYELFANQATFVELGVTAMLDGGRNRALLLPFHLLNFFASTVAICEALLRYYVRVIRFEDDERWDKTRRYRQSNGGFHSLGSRTS